MIYISPTSDSKANQYQCVNQCKTTQHYYLSPSRWGWIQTTSLHVTRCVVVQQTHTLQADRSTPCPAAKGSLCGPLWDTSAGAPVLAQEETYLPSTHRRHEQPPVAEPPRWQGSPRVEDIRISSGCHSSSQFCLLAHRWRLTFSSPTNMSEHGAY